MRNARLFTFALVIMSNSTLASCSAFSTSDDLCGSKVSVADFLASVQDGVAAIPDSQYAQVRISAFDAYDATVAAMENEVTKSAASLLTETLARHGLEPRRSSPPIARPTNQPSRS